MDPVEIVAVIFGFICVWLTVRQNIWCWPTGLVQVVLYVIVFYQARLYSDMGLHVIYIVMQIYGWWNWLHGGQGGGLLKVSRITVPAAGSWLVVAASGIAGLGYCMSTLTDAAVPYWDAATTVLSLIAQWLMAKKILECWLIWITVDVLAIGIYAYKGLYPSTVLYAAFLILATMGFFAWRKTLKAAEPA